MVARTIVQKYSFLKALPPDSPYVSFNFFILLYSCCIILLGCYCSVTGESF